MDNFGRGSLAEVAKYHRPGPSHSLAHGFANSIFS